MAGYERGECFLSNNLYCYIFQFNLSIVSVQANSFCVGSCGSAPGLLEQNPVHVPFSLPGELGNKKFIYPEGFEKTNSSEAASASAALRSQEAYNSATETATTTRTYLDLPVQTDGSRNIHHPPYAINNYMQPGHDLETEAIGLGAVHDDGSVEYDVHSLYGYTQTQATFNSLLSVFPGKRPFILARSTAPGSGKYTAHWGGDNNSLFSSMRRLVPSSTYNRS
jgi:alpha-glucosidase